jgi:deazaflavin-dependent oxidoreductase (nitroreductase family)
MARETVRPYTATEERFGSVLIGLMSKVNVWVYRLSGGRLGGRFIGGAPVMLLTTVGRKTGQPRVAPLLYLRDGEQVVTVASKGGMSKHPLWFRNLETNPNVEVTIDNVTTSMTARRATDEEKRTYWPRLVAMYPDYDVYQRRTDRDIPVVILSLSASPR